MPTNFLPRRYRGVSVTHVDVPLTEENLRLRFIGKQAYRRTEFLVVRSAEDVAVLQISKESNDPLFSPITNLGMVAGPQDSVFVEAPEIDTGVPTQMALVAIERAPGTRCVVVKGLYEHVNFILDAAPIPLRVMEVVPPTPPKLVHQVQRVLGSAEDLPPINVQADIVDLEELARTYPADRYLYPCRGSGAAPQGAEAFYLDERPPFEEWVLIGCERSRQIHRWFYGSEPLCVEMCPLRRTLQTDDLTLTKCCMWEFGAERRERTLVLPWGATLEEVREGLRLILEKADEP